jgi:hypothetical protein
LDCKCCVTKVEKEEGDEVRMRCTYCHARTHGSLVIVISL